MSVTLSAQRHEIIAHNYGAHHANKIHSDEGAALYGFKGALVPGVALYAYCTQAAVRQFGPQWLASGRMNVRFAQPIYHGERIVIESQPIAGEAGGLDVRLIKPDGAVSTTAIVFGGPADAKASPPTSTGFDRVPMPNDAGRREPRIARLSVGEALGTVEFMTPMFSAATSFVDDMRDPLDCYRGQDGLVHPAQWIAQANRVLMGNIRLGPWVHTASEIQHWSRARAGQHLSLRSRVVSLTEKRGNEIISADMILLDEDLGTVATIRHSAIIHLAPKR